MKKLIAAVFVLGVLLIAILGIGIATYDFDRLRPMVARQLSEATGSEVTIQKIGVSLRGGLALRVTGLSFNDPMLAGPEPELRLGSGYLVLQWMPLLSRRIQIGAIEFDAVHLTVVREADGAVSILGIRPPIVKPSVSATTPTASAAPAASGPAVQTIAVLLDSAALKNASIHWVDRNPEFPVDVRFDHMNLTARNIGIGRWVSWQIEAALFGSKPTAAAKGAVRIRPDGSAALKDFEARIDLGGWDAEAVLTGLPKLKEWGIQAPLKGKLELTIEELEFSAADKEVEFRVKSKLGDGALGLAMIPGGIRSIEWDIEATDREARLHRAAAVVFGGEVLLSGRARDYLAETPSIEFETAVRQATLEGFSALWEPLKKLEGKGSVDFAGGFTGLEQQAIRQSLSGKGKIDLESGVIIKANPLKDMIEKLQIVPDLKENLDAHLTPDLKTRIYAERTVLIRPVHQEFAIHKGRLRVQNLNIPAELFELKGDAEVDLAGSFGGQGSFVFNQRLSDALLQSAKGLSIFGTPEGPLAIPFFFEGEPGRVAIRPDLGRLKLEAVVERGKELMRELFQKVTTKDESSAGAASTESKAPASGESNAKPSESLKDLIKEWMPERKGS